MFRILFISFSIFLLNENKESLSIALSSDILSNCCWSDFNLSSCLEITSCFSSTWKRFKSSIFRSNSSLNWSKDNFIFSSRSFNLSLENSCDNLANSSISFFISSSMILFNNSWILFCLSINKLSCFVKLWFKEDFFKLSSFTEFSNLSNFSFFSTIPFDNCCFSQLSTVLSSIFRCNSFTSDTISFANFSASLREEFIWLFVWIL